MNKLKARFIAEEELNILAIDEFFTLGFFDSHFSQELCLKQLILK